MGVLTAIPWHWYSTAWPCYGTPMALPWHASLGLTMGDPMGASIGCPMAYGVSLGSAWGYPWGAPRAKLGHGVPHWNSISPSGDPLGLSCGTYFPWCRPCMDGLSFSQPPSHEMVSISWSMASLCKARGKAHGFTYTQPHCEVHGIADGLSHRLTQGLTHGLSHGLSHELSHGTHGRAHAHFHIIRAI